jgi:hypothetical protein
MVTPAPSAAASPVAVEDVDVARDESLPGRLLTSRRFGLPITFSLNNVAGVHATSRMLQVDLCEECVSAIRIVRPAAVDCGLATRHPSADELAAAIEANPGLGAVGLGLSETHSGLSPGLFRDPVPGWIIRIPGDARPLDASAVDPDRCSIVSDGPTIELRGDLYAYLIVFSVDDELVILHATDAGIDGPSGARFLDRHQPGHPMLPSGAKWDTQSRIFWTGQQLLRIRHLAFK